MEGTVINKVDEALEDILKMTPEELEEVFSQFSGEEIADLIAKLKEVTKVE